MIGELVAIALVIVLPATVILGMLALVGLAAIGFAPDPEARRLVRR